MLDLGSTYDRWLFGFIPRQGETISNTHWQAVVLGNMAGLVWVVKSLIISNSEPEVFSLSIAGSIVLIIAIVYIVKNVPLFTGVAKKILRTIYILFVCSIGFSFGYFLGMVVGMLIIGVVVLWLFGKILFAMLCSAGSPSSSSNPPKKRYILDDGTEVKEVGNNIYEDVSGYTRYRKGTFTDDFTKIDW